MIVSYSYSNKFDFSKEIIKYTSKKKYYLTMRVEQRYTIKYLTEDDCFEGVGPLVISHSELGVQRAGAGGNTLDASIDVYALKSLKVWKRSDENNVREYENYHVYELRSSGPLLSFQVETLLGDYPLLSKAIYAIAMFEEYGEITSWMPENTLTWDAENNVLTVL